MSPWRAVVRSTLVWLGGIGLTISGALAGYVPSIMTREQIAAQNPYFEAFAEQVGHGAKHVVQMVRGDRDEAGGNRCGSTQRTRP